MCPCAIAVRRRQSLLRATGDSTPGYAGPPLRGGEPPAPLRGDAVRALRRERVRRGDSAGDRGRRRLRSRGIPRLGPQRPADRAACGFHRAGGEDRRDAPGRHLAPAPVLSREHRAPRRARQRSGARAAAGGLRARGRRGPGSGRRDPRARRRIPACARHPGPHLAGKHGIFLRPRDGRGRIRTARRRPERRGRPQGPAHAAHTLRAGGRCRKSAPCHPAAGAAAAPADGGARATRARRDPPAFGRCPAGAAARLGRSRRRPRPGSGAGGRSRGGPRPRVLHRHRLQPLRGGLSATAPGPRAVRHAARPVRGSPPRGRILARPRRAGAARMLTIALPKGRLQKPALERFARAGVVPDEEPGIARGLLIPAGSAARFVLLKAGDVPLYVERGAADLGVCGIDQVLESAADLLTPIDFGFGRCRLCLAAPGGKSVTAELGRSLRVATKYPPLSSQWFVRRGVPVDLVHLFWSVELAAVSGLTDAIVDLVESGRTLEENGLVVIDEILQVTARLVVNRASYRLKVEELLPLLEKLG